MGEALMMAPRSLFLCFLILSAPASRAQLSEPADPPQLVPGSGEATVYFYRARGVDRDADIWGFVGETPVGVLRAREYVGARVAAGEQLI